MNTALEELTSSGTCSYQTANCEFGCNNKLCAEDPCVGVDTSDKCVNSFWYHDGRCSGGNVIYDTKDQCAYGCQGESVSILSVLYEGGMCRSSPCEGVTCDNYCSGTTLFTSGECNSGKCVYDDSTEYSEDCGYVHFYEKTSFLVAVSLFAIIIILIGFFKWRGKR
jgi:hypothetical protein